ncbi:hypothetical protein XENOCAPTIV_018564 [Xenoophorus captivus]|uniref:Uncharacterized protein n=1 Tax=Xenoophorus captivus TaxID=1517983 RepID=A0ABV0R9R8_9TELE
MEPIRPGQATINTSGQAPLLYLDQLAILVVKCARFRSCSYSVEDRHTIKASCEDYSRYKRRWNLRVIGLPEKDDETIREFIIGILTQIIPMSMDHLRVTVDTVHRLGRKTNPATSNNELRAVMIKFGMCTVQDEVWKKSKDAKVCKDLHISFKEDFSKEDRLARAKLWPLVQEARSRGRRAYLTASERTFPKRTDSPEPSYGHWSRKPGAGADVRT